MPKHQMRPIPGADIVEHSKQEAEEQDHDSRINGKAQYRQDFVNGTDPGWFEMKSQIFLDQVPFKAKNTAVKVTKDRRRGAAVGDQQSKAGHTFEYDASVDQ